MNDILYAYFLLQIPFKAFAYRARGGAIPLGSTTLARIVFWGLPYSIDGAVFAYLLNIRADFIVPMAILSVITAWFAAMVQHSKWQSPSWHNYVIMGTITTGMLTIMLSPFLYFNPNIMMFLPLGMLGTFASWLGYKMKGGLKLFGIQWCVPSDSSWEEFYIGAMPFGIVIAAIGFYLI